MHVCQQLNELIWSLALSCFFRSLMKLSSAFSTGITIINKKVHISYEVHFLGGEGAVKKINYLSNLFCSKC